MADEEVSWLGAAIAAQSLAVAASQPSLVPSVARRQRELSNQYQHNALSQMGAMTAVGSAIGSFDSFLSRGGPPMHPTGKQLTEDDYFAEVKDSRGRLHSVNGAPGRKWSDGNEEFFWHGVNVPEMVVRDPELITVAMIEIEENAEVRRVMIERYGQQRYMVDCGAALASKDETGELYKKNMGQHEEPLVFVKVKNSTPEPDGSIKDYFLRVPPQTKTARAGVAWTFGLDTKAYAPQKQT